MKNSLIQWTRHTYNPWLGCRKVAPECAKCYIVRQTPLRVRHITHGATRHRCGESTRNQPFAWNRAAEEAHEKHFVFCLSLGDWLDDEVPIEWLVDLLDVIRQCDSLIWQMLTKRPQNWYPRLLSATAWLASAERGNEDLFNWIDDWLKGRVPENVWIGVSAGANQAAALDIPAVIHFLSCEPMLHALDTKHAANFNWIIFGGESEPGGEPRPFDVIHLDDALHFCRRHNVPAFVKQMGGAPVFHQDFYRSDNGVVTAGWGDHVTFPGGCTIRLHDRQHGGDATEWPARFQVRNFPIAA